MKIHTVGGFSEVGKNMSVLEMGDDAIILDSGLYLPAIVNVAERERDPTEKSMRELGALPDDGYLERKNLRSKVRAMLISHAHLDHLGALQYNSYRYNADIVGTPFTTEVLKVLLADCELCLRNKIVAIKPNGIYNVRGKKNYKVEFLNMTHSTYQTSIVAVHTPEGVVLYANDFKLDNTPTFGEAPNYQRLRQLAKQGVKALIFDALYAPDDRKTPSEKIAKGLLEDVFFTTDNHKSGMIITTFSSHVARLKTITEMGRQLGREVIFMGRSLNKYMTAAKNTGHMPFLQNVKICTFRNQLERTIRQVNANKRKYLVVCTGHQGEPGSILDRIARHELPLNLSQDDQVIFSSKTIPSPSNEVNRETLERHLRKYKVRIFDNVHVSGHGGREDIRELIKMTQPQHIIPSHGDLKKLSAAVELAEEMGYKSGKNVHLTADGKMLQL